MGETSTELDLISHSMVNEVAKPLISWSFLTYSVTDTLKNTLIANIRQCGFVTGGDWKN
jgi:hypothetical protein